MAAGRQQLWKSVLRLTGRDPARVGYWLLRHRRAEGLRPARLARDLGVRMEGLALLSLCLTPREDHFREDLDVICRRAGADALALARILRRQQALARWAGQGSSPDTASPAGGWLIAASDAPGPEEKTTDESPPGEEGNEG